MLAPSWEKDAGKEDFPDFLVLLPWLCRHDHSTCVGLTNQENFFLVYQEDELFFSLTSRGFSYPDEDLRVCILNVSDNRGREQCLQSLSPKLTHEAAMKRETLPPDWCGTYLLVELATPSTMTFSSSLLAKANSRAER